MLYKNNLTRKNQYGFCLGNTRRNRRTHRHRHTQQDINKNIFLAPTDIVEILPIAVTIKNDIVWKPVWKPTTISKNENAENENAENENAENENAENENAENENAENENTENENTENENTENENTNKLGFIILRNVYNTITNEYWKECFRCIRKFYPNNRVLIIDDNSDKQFVTNEVLNNTMIIESEFRKRGEFLPYYYYLRTNFCEKVVILHDSMYIKKYINFYDIVDEYNFLIYFDLFYINDSACYQSQLNLLRALNNKNLNKFYNKKEQGLWNGCFGSMTAISYNFLKQIDEEFRFIQMIPYITTRVERCAFERIIGCMLQYKCKKSSLFGHVNTNCDWSLDFNKYKQNMYDSKKPIIKVFTGR